MPFTCAPSNVFPEGAVALSTEAKEKFTWQQPAAAESPRAYRGSAPTPAPLQMAHPSVGSELAKLKARLAALEPTAVVTNIDATAADSAPWAGPNFYTTFASYAGEASRVKDSGRLPFGSDTKKMALK